MKQLIYILFLLSSLITWGQEDSTATSTEENKYATFSTPEDYELDLEAHNETKKEFKKKKPKKKVFYGLKTRRAFVAKDKGAHQVLEIFFYLKKWQDPNTFVKDIYWFDPLKQKIIKSHKYDPKTSKLLHGPYVKKYDNEVIERGVFYKGVKHARWEKWSTTKTIKVKDTIEIQENNLIAKEKYNRGWPKYAEITYFDAAKKQYKEIIPYNEAKELHGEYFKYYKNGKLAEYGKYEHGYKVGKWSTYHNSRGKYHFKDKILAYPKKAFYSTDTEPFLIGSWNSKGTQLEDNLKAYNEKVKKEIQEKQKR